MGRNFELTQASGSNTLALFAVKGLIDFVNAPGSSVSTLEEKRRFREIKIIFSHLMVPELLQISPTLGFVGRPETILPCS